MRLMLAGGLAALGLVGPLRATPLYYRVATTPDGTVKIFADSDDNSQFWWIPLHTEVSLGAGGNLYAFDASYFGIGDRYMQQDATGIHSVIGGSIAGSARLGLSQDQRQNVLETIKKEFKVANPH